MLRHEGNAVYFKSGKGERKHILLKASSLLFSTLLLWWPNKSKGASSKASTSTTDTRASVAYGVAVTWSMGRMHSNRCLIQTKLARWPRSSSRGLSSPASPVSWSLPTQGRVKELWEMASELPENLCFLGHLIHTQTYCLPVSGRNPGECMMY